MENIAGSTWIKVVLAAIIVIPMLYSGIFLGSMWDPYGNADKIPVAVVNEDNKVTYNGSSLHIGEDLVANLKKAKEMDFCFVDAAKASQGLKDGSYYMIITIPENFSSNATTLMDKHPGAIVNLETDVIGKYVHSFTVGHPSSASSGLTMEKLLENGF